MKRFAAAVLIAGLGAGTASAELLAYEGFNYTAGQDLNGQSGGFGFVGASTWNSGFTGTNGDVKILDGTGAEVWDGNFVGVTQTGVFAGGTQTNDHMWGDRALATSVTDTFTDGATTWFSVIAAHNGVGFERPIFAIGADVLLEDRAKNSAGENIGMGARFNSSDVRAQYWVDQLPGTAQEEMGLSSTGLIGNSNLDFLMAKITWSDAGNDTLSVARFASGATITEAAFDAATQSTVVADLDQSVFDTLNFHGGRYYLDEIRIATTFDDAVNAVPEPGSLALLGLGGLLMARRRRA